MKRPLIFRCRKCGFQRPPRPGEAKDYFHPKWPQHCGDSMSLEADRKVKPTPKMGRLVLVSFV